MKRENWLKSKKKWEKIVKNIKNENAYAAGRFYDVNVLTTCGYCDEYNDSDGSYLDCSDCPLPDNNLCGSSEANFSVMDDYLDDRDYTLALPIAQKILDFIISDEPAKATK